MSICVYCGPMFAGKTTELLRLAQRSTFAKRVPVLINHTFDTRYTESSDVVNHDQNVRLPCIVASRLANVTLPSDATHVYVNEAQFFDDLVAMCRAWMRRGLHVVVAGLDLTYLDTPWPNMAALMAHATAVQKLSAVCAACGAEATHTIKKKSTHAADAAAVVDIGAGEKYEPRCLTCFYLHNDDDDENRSDATTESSSTNAVPSKGNSSTTLTNSRAHVASASK